LSRVSPVHYSPRRQSRWVLADYGGKDLWKRWVLSLEWSSECVLVGDSKYNANKVYLFQLRAFHKTVQDVKHFSHAGIYAALLTKLTGHQFCVDVYNFLYIHLAVINGKFSNAPVSGLNSSHLQPISPISMADDWTSSAHGVSCVVYDSSTSKIVRVIDDVMLSLCCFGIVIPLLP